MTEKVADHPTSFEGSEWRSGEQRDALGKPHAFWQARFYDFNVYSEGKRKEKLKYMHANPVKRGLVGHPKDWPWSSWGFYFGKESPLIPMDLQD